MRTVQPCRAWACFHVLGAKTSRREIESKPPPHRPPRVVGFQVTRPLSQARPHPLSQRTSGSVKGHSHPLISNGIFPTIPGTEKSVGKVMGEARSLDWLQERGRR